MDESAYEKMRGKARYAVTLDATYSVKGQATGHQRCLIANLSSSGATARFPRTETLQSGSVIKMDIKIPDTIMRVETEAEIMWTRQRFNELVGGIKFTGALSTNMMQQLVQKSADKKGSSE